MKTTLLALLVASSLLGCSKKKEGEAGGGGDPCETAINKAIDGMMASRKGGPNDQMNAIASKLRGVMTERCKADGWPKEALDCYAGATDQPSIRKCREALPPEKAQKLQTEIIKIMSGGMRPGGMRPGMGGPGGPGGRGPGPHGGPPPAAGGGGGSSEPAGSATP